jgi:NAD+ synthase (glutamine-hydrolysing)
VNAGIPKTVAQAMLHSFANNNTLPTLATEQIKKILNKPISPELIPTDKTGATQDTEKIIGPYILHDFFLYYFLKYFFSKEKILYITGIVFKSVYSDDEIEKTYDIFIKRFVQNQYKRSCCADGPAIYDISLSPRNGSVFPSDIASI